MTGLQTSFDVAGREIEAREKAKLPKSHGEKRNEVGAAPRWWTMAARARRAADWVSPKDHLLLLRLAEEYEARAKLAEDEAAPSQG
jgi:hypothetical protein